MGLGFGALAGLMGIGAGISSAQSLMNNAFSEKALKKQYEYQSQLQSQQQNWLENMSNTAHQRAISDMKKAGLNPILAATNGASTPTAGMGNLNAPQYSVDAMSGMNSALAAANTQSDLQLKSAQAQLMQEQSLTESTQQRINLAKAIEQEGLNSFLNERQRAELKKLGSEIINLDANSAWMKAKQNAISSEIDLNSAQALLARTNAEWTPSKIGSGIVTGAVGALGLTGLGKAGKVGKAIKHVSARFRK